MECLMHIQDYLNGKTKQEVEDAVVSGRIEFDEGKYRLVGSDAKMSGYAADFTEQYKKQMQNILGTGVYSSGVFSKLDDILSAGYKFYNTNDTELYISGNDIFYGNGKSRVRIYEFRKEDETRELLVANGDVVKGSLAMATRTSNHLENRYEDIFNKQDYVAEVFGVQKRLAAYVTTVLRKLDDEEFDKMVDMFFDYVRQVMNKLSIRGNNKSGFRYAFSVQLSDNSPDECKRIIDTMFHFVGSNGEMLKMLKLFVGKGNAYSVRMTRDLIVAVMKKELIDVIAENDISIYRDFVSEIGQYDGGYTQDIASIVEITDMEMEILSFIFEYGDRNDFKNYMTTAVYDTKTKKLKKSSLPDIMIEQIYDCVKDSGTYKLPISSKRAYSIYNEIIKSGMPRKFKAECTDAIMSMMCSGRAVRYNLLAFVREVIAGRGGAKRWEDRSGLLCDVIKNTVTKADVAEILIQHDELMNTTSEKFEKMAKEIEEHDDNQNVMDVMKKYFGDCSIKDGKIEIVNTIYSIECRKEKELSQETLTKIEMCIRANEFAEKCDEMFNDIINKGVSETFVSDGITATIMNNGNICTVVFTDSSHTAEYDMGESSYEVYNEKIQLSIVADAVRELYEKAVAIVNDDASGAADTNERILDMFSIKKLCQYSPDQILVWHLNENKKVRLGSANKSSIAEYLIGKGGYSVKVDELSKLQSIIRQAYVSMYKYNDMLVTEIGLSPSKLFVPCVYSIKNKALVNLSNAMCDNNGNVYIGVEKLFNSEQLKEIMQKITQDEMASREKIEEFNRTLSDDAEIAWNSRIQFIEDAVKNHDICRKDLFGLIHGLWLKEDGLDWVRSILSDVDVYAVADYREYERKLGTSKNAVMLRL